MNGTVLVTGGTGGLGNAVTAAFLEVGHRVVVPWVVRKELDRLAAHPDLVPVEADLFDPAGAEACVAAATAVPERPLKAVVNLVGGFASGGRLHETPVEDFERMLRLNLRAGYLTCQAALPHLLSSGGGAIVLVSAGTAERPFPGAAGYITAKTAVLGLVAALAAEYGGSGVRANAILPGVIDTPANRAAQPDADRTRWVAPERIAETIVFLCGPGSAAINGARIPVAG